MHQNKHTIDRRTWLKLAGSAGAQVALAGCSALSLWRSGDQYVRPLSTQPFHRPDIDASQIVKTLVGLRPYRASGFVVRGERIDEKIVIHNYGHGGGGITLSWGSSSLAEAEASNIADKRAAVIGYGVMGLSTARQLQQRGWRVTIYAKDLPPNTTSNLAGGECVASSVFSRLEVSAAFDAQFREAMRLSHEWFA
jgi:glycine/D-amino acid oxidase-like deaminating enzyme